MLLPWPFSLSSSSSSRGFGKSHVWAAAAAAARSWEDLGGFWDPPHTEGLRLAWLFGSSHPVTGLLPSCLRLRDARSEPRHV